MATCEKCGSETQSMAYHICTRLEQRVKALEDALKSQPAAPASAEKPLWKQWQDEQELKPFSQSIAENSIRVLEEANASLRNERDEFALRNERLRGEIEEAHHATVEEIQNRDAARQERDELRAQLPEGMKHCTILHKECSKGHGRLTATNWVDHGCDTCERDTLKAKLASAEKALDEIEGLWKSAGPLAWPSSIRDALQRTGRLGDKEQGK